MVPTTAGAARSLSPATRRSAWGAPPAWVGSAVPADTGQQRAVHVQARSRDGPFEGKLPPVTNARLAGPQETAMTNDTITELNRRSNDGIDVRLLWDREDSRVFVTVDDTKT